nr:EOG090X07SL [Moina brachiata]
MRVAQIISHIAILDLEYPASAIWRRSSSSNLCPIAAKSTALKYGPCSKAFKHSKAHLRDLESTSSSDFSSNDPYAAYHELSIPHLPDMVFADNLLRIQHKNGSGLEFNALEALKLVNDHEDLVKVAVAEAWKEARAGMENVHQVSHPFDWTFTTEYRGTITGDVKVSPTDLRIDMEKLKQKERILFFDEVHLYEDELADHGCASCSLKRCMPSGFFVLLRFYLRVDDVLIRINDTRVYYEVEKSYVLREYTSRESRTKDLKVPRVFWGDPNEISQHLPLVNAIYEKMEFLV